MESNFIKERIVVRENIIRKNLKDAKKTSSKPGAATSSKPVENIQEKVLILEDLVNEGLRQDLVIISQQVDSICQTLADYGKVKSALKIFKNHPRDARVQTNIGCNFYAQCNIEDTTKVYLCIGLDYFLHMELDEAMKMIDFKEDQLMKNLDRLQERAAKIKAYIKIALEAMDKLTDP